MSSGISMKLVSLLLKNSVAIVFGLGEVTGFKGGRHEYDQAPMNCPSSMK